LYVVLVDLLGLSKRAKRSGDVRFRLRRALRQGALLTYRAGYETAEVQFFDQIEVTGICRL